MKEVNDLLKRLGELEDAPLIWVNKKVFDMADEIKRLKQGYCPIKEKCNAGECDCTNEEYNQMCEGNIKLHLEREKLKDIIKDIRKDIEVIEQIDSIDTIKMNLRTIIHKTKEFDKD